MRAGRFVFRAGRVGTAQRSRPLNVHPLAQLWIYAIALALLAQLLAPRISRRLANAAYGCWVLSVSLTILAIAMTLDSRGPRVDPDPIIESVNARMLFVFIGSNLLTGLVNVSMDTLSVPAFPALLLLVAYVTTVCVCARALSRL